MAPVNSPSGLRGGLGHGGLAPPVAHVNSHGGGGQGHGGIAAPVAPVNSPSGLRGGQGHGGLVPPVAPVNSQGGGGQGHGGTAAPVAPANSPSSLRGGQGHGGLAPPVAPVNSLNGRGGQGRGGVAAPVAPVNSPGGRDQQRRGVAPPSQSQRNAPSGVGAAQPAPAGPNPRVVRRTCPACKEKLRAPGGQAERLVCECCRAEFHKKRECSGLTRHQVRVWQTSGRWTCIACSNQRRQDAANAPGVAKATDPKRDIGTRDKLKVMQWNADGLRTAEADLLGFVTKSPDIDVLLIQETKLLPTDRTPVLPGYAAVRRDRPLAPGGAGGRGGGLLTFVRHDIAFRTVSAYQRVDAVGKLEALAVEIPLSPGGNFTIVNIYNPPARGLGAANSGIQSLRVPVAPFIVAGDFNAHSPLWDDACQSADRWGEQLELWMDDNGVSSLNDGSGTHVCRASGSEGAPDVSLAHNSAAAGCIWSRLSMSGSDHYPLLCEVDVSPITLVESGGKKLRWNLGAGDWDGYRARMERKVEECQLPPSATLSQKVTFVTDAILSAANTHVGSIRVRQHGRTWMTPELKLAIQRRNALGRRIADNRLAWLEACREVRLLTITAKKQSWHSYVERMCKDGSSSTTKVWGVIHSLSGKQPAPTAGNEMLEHRGRTLASGSRKADVFVQHYAGVSRHISSKDSRKLDRKVREKLTLSRRLERDAGVGVGPECADFTMDELRKALKAGKKKGAEGPDRIAPLFLRNLGDKALEYILGCFNQSWREGVCPQAWRDAIIIPLLKAGKPAGELASYRPIALTSCLGKVMERLVSNRLQHLAEVNGWFCQEQAGFRPQRSTEDQILRLTQSISDSLQSKPPRRSVLALLDFSKAYDKVWRSDLYDAMLKKGVPPRYVRWVKGFLTNRQARVRLGGSLSHSKLFREGVPQGSVLSPLLFLFVVDSLRARLPPGVEVSIFADDVALWASDVDKTVAASKVEEGVREVFRWSQEKKLMLNLDKCETSFFSTDPHEAKWQPQVMAEGKLLKFNPTPVFLGVMYDRTLSFGPQAERTAAALFKKNRLLVALAGSDWGCDGNLLRQVYQSVLLSGVSYCGGGWKPWAAKTTIDTIDRAQNRCLRRVTGQFSSTPVEALRFEAGFQSADCYARREALLAWEKSVRLPQAHPRRVIALSRVPHRLARSSWREKAMGLAAGCGFSAHAPLPLPPPTSAPWGWGEPRWKVHLHLEGGSRRQDAPERKLADALNTIRSFGQRRAIIYTDGSAEGGVRHGGSSSVVCDDDPENPQFLLVEKQKGPEFTTSFETECWALILAVTWLSDFEDPDDRWLICSDSFSALSALAGGSGKPHTLVVKLKELLDGVVGEVDLQWVPSHCGLSGNERADLGAREAAALNPGQGVTEAPLSLESLRATIPRVVVDPVPDPVTRALVGAVYSGKRGNAQGLRRRDEVLLAQLRSGESKLLASYRAKVLGEDPVCPKCHGGDETLVHFWQECPASESLRRRLWDTIPPPLSLMWTKPKVAIQYCEESRLLG